MSLKNWFSWRSSGGDTSVVLMSGIGAASGGQLNENAPPAVTHRPRSGAVPAPAGRVAPALKVQNARSFGAIAMALYGPQKLFPAASRRTNSLDCVWPTAIGSRRVPG